MECDPTVRVVVMLDRPAEGRDTQVLEALCMTGLKIQNHIVSFGIVIGAAPPAAIEELARIDGVASVRREEVMPSPRDPIGPQDI